MNEERLAEIRETAESGALADQALLANRTVLELLDEVERLRKNQIRGAREDPDFVLPWNEE